MQHLIMLRVLTAQPADESTSFAPRNAQRFHVCNLPFDRRLAPEESPPLAIRPFSDAATIGHVARVGPHLFPRVPVEPGDLGQPELQGDREGLLWVPGIPELDQLREFFGQSRRKLGGTYAGLRSFVHERADRVRCGREAAHPPKLFEPSVLLEREAHPQESGRTAGPFGVSHA